MNWKIGLTLIGACALLLLAGCTQEMADQPRCEPYEASAFFEDGQCVRPLPPNAVAREYVRDFYAGQAGGQADTAGAGDSGGAELTAEGLPFELTRAVLEVGQDRYLTFCAPCHGSAGYGDGMIVQRGFPPPPSLHSERLQQVPPEYIVQVITDGFGIMYSYAYRVPEDERWAIAAYIKALQLSQDAPAEAQGDPPTSADEVQP